MEHIPVMLDEILDQAGKIQKPVLRILDVTFGRGGHSRELLSAFPESHLTAFDRDLAAVDVANSEFSPFIEQNRFEIHHTAFADADMSQFEPFDLILMDLGVSSPQLDQAERGFSFYQSGPLDMRMDQSTGETAADIVNNWDQQDLSDLFYQKGEIKFPNKVVRAIVEHRKEKTFVTTQDLSRLIEQKEGWSKKSHHPATRYFLALRLQVNGELEQVESALPKMVESLSPLGQLMVLTFHSLEDRIAKVKFKELSATHGRRVNKKVLQAKWPERKKNPRARSAKLRIFERGDSSIDIQKKE